jgi:hypothetical protein
LVLTSLSANYTRIGNMVFAYATVTYPATVDASAARIGGLPVAVPNIGYAQVPFYIRNTGGAFGTFGLAASGTSTFVILNDVSGAAVTNAQLSSLIVCWMAIYPAT